MILHFLLQTWIGNYRKKLRKLPRGKKPTAYKKGLSGYNLFTKTFAQGNILDIAFMFTTVYINYMIWRR